MKNWLRLLVQSAICLALGMAFFPTTAAHAHALPVSYLDVKLDATGASITLEASVKDWLRESPSLDGEVLLSSEADTMVKPLLALLGSRLQMEGDGKAMPLHLSKLEPLPDRGDVRMRLRANWLSPKPRSLRVHCHLFPRDPAHKTFLALYRDGELARESIFDENTSSLEVRVSPQSQSETSDTTGTLTVVKRFMREGVHHIFIGPDHILFIVGLLLLGGGMWKLLKIVTAFTIAHSLTLALATLGLLNPSPRLIEPLIALSIVFVGVHDLRLLRAHPETGPEMKPDSSQRSGPDVRLLFAFVFGLVHGFGFASVLRELDLPRAALFWSLGAFNLGVEIGQMCIVLSVAPFLALLGRRHLSLARRVAFGGAAIVVAAGAFWFVQRVAFA